MSVRARPTFRVTAAEPLADNSTISCLRTTNRVSNARRIQANLQLNTRSTRVVAQLTGKRTLLEPSSRVELYNATSKLNSRISVHLYSFPPVSKLFFCRIVFRGLHRHKNNMNWEQHYFRIEYEHEVCICMERLHCVNTPVGR
jgi:hypothetical protein